jgi:streptogramin lyase
LSFFSSGFEPNALPDPIVTGPDGNLWTVDSNGVAAYQITTAGGVTPFQNIAGPRYVFDLAVGPDGNLWITSTNPPGLVRLTL